MEHKRNFTDCFLFVFEDMIFKEDEVGEVWKMRGRSDEWL